MVLVVLTYFLISGPNYYSSLSSYTAINECSIHVNWQKITFIWVLFRRGPDHIQ